MSLAGIPFSESSTEASSKQVLLDHAEALFATHGYDGVSLRELTRQAGTNLGAVNYHFGTKEKLFEDVVLRRVRPINELRLAGLQQALDRAGSGSPELADVLEAFARPVVMNDGGAHRESLRRMVVRMFMEADPLITPIFAREFAPIARQFRAAIARACPQLSQQQVDSGLVFYAGAMINLLAAEKRMAMFLPSSEPPPGDEKMLQYLIRFGVAGFAALSAGPFPAAANPLPQSAAPTVQASTNLRT
jgi:AcrR family transcriptional regulator